MRTYRFITLFSLSCNKEFSKLWTWIHRQVCQFYRRQCAQRLSTRGKQLWLCIPQAGPKALVMGQPSLRKFPTKPPPHIHITPACPALLTCSWSPQRDLACSSAPSPAFPALPGGYPAAYAGCQYRSQTGAPGCSLWHLNSGSAPAAAPTWSPIPYSAAPGTAPEPEQEDCWAGIIPRGWAGQRRDWEWSPLPTSVHDEDIAGAVQDLHRAEERSSWENNLCWKKIVQYDDNDPKELTNIKASAEVIY